MDLQVDKNLAISKIKNQLLKELARSSGNQKTPFSNQNAPSARQQSSSAVSPELQQIIETLTSLQPTLQQQILTIWSKLNLPLNVKIMNKLSSFLSPGSGNNLPEDKTAVIKSFAYLLKNKLPLSPLLIKSLTQLQQADNQLNQLFSDELDLPRNLPENLAVNFNNSAEALQKQLSNYPQLFKDLLTSLYENYSSRSQENSIFEKLLGEQLININKTDNNLIMALEIPLFLANKKELIPLFLKMRRLTEKYKDGENKKSDPGFQIEFIIELQKRGTIKAKITIRNRKIEAKFWTTSSRTSNLIKKYFPDLKNNLEQENYNISPPQITEFDKDDTCARSEIADFFAREIFPENIKNYRGTASGNKEYRHFDFKV